ncbi:broad-complex core protein isoforms 1/2/3/4/5 isoform X2 [Photinus pyralis]|uniref:broad-complex core protein isoforms 1/2/3/4/5 isoform X2 n=1 Tax=Photinus pyralis TaxID=7054 RepID=UPI0012676A88|nr:broad-complex core protein isoforms 1/2/3/4/5 isoform X2 [Photinus pyralis]
MVDTQHFCLRWNNYQSSITSAFENLRDDEDFVDVTLACDGKSLKAHRVVLSACSPYFRELLKSTPCKHPVIVLQDVAWTDLHALVEFIYHGEVNVHQRSLSSFLKTAEVLRVSGLTQQQHGDDREQLAQVQSLVRSQQQPTPIPNHHPAFTEKLVEDALFTSPSSPPHGATVNQLLRRAALQHRRERRISSDPENELKRARSDLILGNNNNNNNNNNELHLSHSAPPQTQPADFSPSAMKNSILNLNTNITSNSLLNSTHKNDSEGNGISSTDREHSPCSPSPTHNNRMNNNDEVKAEPMELLCSTNQDQDNSNDSVDAPNDNGPSSNMPQGPLSGSSGGDHDDHDSPIGPYLTPSESKLFATAAGSFNFSMAALAADPSALGGLNQSLQPNADSLAGTSQGAVVRMPPPTSGGINEPQECPYCRRTFSCYYSLKRHFQDKHEQSDTLYVCEFCHRRYRTKNSLTTHKSLQHRGSSGMLKRLLKTSAIKSVLGPQPPPPPQPPRLL